MCCGLLFKIILVQLSLNGFMLPLMRLKKGKKKKEIAEGALLLGFWTASSSLDVPELCRVYSRHS